MPVAFRQAIAIGLQASKGRITRAADLPLSVFEPQLDVAKGLSEGPDVIVGEERLLDPTLDPVPRVGPGGLPADGLQLCPGINLLVLELQEILL